MFMYLCILNIYGWSFLHKYIFFKPQDSDQLSKLFRKLRNEMSCAQNLTVMLYIDWDKKQ